ncbi:MAG: SIR2 family NAD-dependent protein deacylase [Thermomicrobiales bacterium]
MISSDQQSQLANLAANATRMLALTGAGVSTESGIPDYRGPNGVWATQKPPTLGDYETNVEARIGFWKFRRESYPRMLERQPNQGHFALAALEHSGKLFGVITQNIDGLHQKAGNDPGRVVELHGTTHEVRCIPNNHRFSGVDIQARLEAGEADPHCVICGGVLRSSTILFGEPLPKVALDHAVAMSQVTDLMLIIGTSLVVNPAAQLPLVAKRRGARLVIINRESTPLDDQADLVIRGDAGPTLSTMVERLALEPGLSPST